MSTLTEVTKLSTNRAGATMNLILIAVTLIVLHNVDGTELLVNPKQIVSLQATNEGGARGTPQQNKLIAGGHRCVIALTNGKFLSVVETCEAVVKAMEDAR